MISEKKKKSKTLAIMLVLGLAMLFTFQMNPVSANIPEVTNIEWYTIGLDTYVNITVVHASPDSTHYVDQVNVQVRSSEGGTPTYDVSLGSQSTETFFVQYDLGRVDEYFSPYVSAQGVCTIHGEGSYSTEVRVPEFSTLSLLLVLAIASITVLLFKSRAKLNSNET